MCNMNQEHRCEVSYSSEARLRCLGQKECEKHQCSESHGKRMFLVANSKLSFELKKR